MSEARPRAGDTDSARTRGMAKMQEVYGFSVDPDEIPGPYVDFTVDHLFGEVWTRPALDIRDRRLMTIGVLAALDQPQLIEIQFRSALDRGEMTEDQVREAVVHLTHYVGWPLSTGDQRRRRAGHRRSPAERPGERVVSSRMPDPTPLRWSGSTSAGKVAIVTGSGGGIGQAYAEALASAGASVMVADIAEARAAEVAAAIVASGGKAESVRVDVADPESAQAMAALTVERFGGIDYLVNNAAIFGEMQLDLLLTVDWEYLNRFLSVNMLGALNCVRACYPAMKARGGGAIVNQSSTAAYLYAGFYGLAKAGVNSITQQLAHELGGQHIRTNAIAPGPIDTEASRTVVPDAFMKPILDSLAIKRQGEPSDLVGMCLFLLSDEASWITGHVFNVDGGQVVRP